MKTKTLPILFTTLCLTLATLCLTGCKSVKYVSVPEYHTLYKSKVDTLHLKDSVYLHDSIYTEVKGDTVYINRLSVRNKVHYLYKAKIDTITQTDTITRIVYKDKPVTRWQKIKEDWGEMAIGVIVIAIVLFVVITYTIKIIRTHIRQISKK